VDVCNHCVRGHIQFGFIEENAGGNRLIVVDAVAGQVVFIPQGVLHFSHNLQCTPASFLANFGHRDPGTQTMWAAMMHIPTPILAVSASLFRVFVLF
jgi:oxalate decarboxylase/phosphoglucose isomerase-like protein (cupin superfamily)